MSGILIKAMKQTKYVTNNQDICQKIIEIKSECDLATYEVVEGVA